ncbi:hypothetical protein pb186bvf_006767 [Paramecium bursaria]
MQGKKVLVADDEPFAQQALQMMYSALKVDTVMVSDGKKAFEEYQKNPNFTYILMDLHMPGVDGYDSTKMIRAHEKSKNLPACKIIGLSADGDAKTKDACMTAGMNDLLKKPVKKDLLANIHYTIFQLSIIILGLVAQDNNFLVQNSSRINNIIILICEFLYNQENELISKNKILLIYILEPQYLIISMKIAIFDSQIKQLLKEMMRTEYSQSEQLISIIDQRKLSNQHSIKKLFHKKKKNQKIKQ